MTTPHGTAAGEVPADAERRVQVLMRSVTYWTARAMQEQGSRFYRAIGQALDAADAGNRRVIYAAWPDECWDFYLRGLTLQAQEEGGADAG